MPKYTELQNKETIFTPVRTNSGSESSEAASEIFGKISEKFAQKAVTVGEEKSNAALYQATNQIYRLKNVIQEDFYRNPDQIRPLMDSAISDVKQIVQQSPLNEKDRQRLDYLSKNDITDIEANGLKFERDYSQRQAKISFMSDWPEKLQQIHDSWDKDEKTIKYQQENAHNLLVDAYSGGFIDQKQYESMYNTLDKTFQSVKLTHKIFEEQGGAKDYHNAKSRFDTKNTFHQVNAPYDETTNFLYQHHVSQYNASDAEAALYNDTPIDVETFSNLTFEQQQSIDRQRDAINHVKAIWSSNGSWEELQSVRDSLDDKKQEALTSDERAIKSYLDNFFTRFGKDKYLTLVSSTSMGSSITYDYNMNMHAIDNNRGYTPEKKEILKRQYDNEYSDRMTALGISKGIPNDKIMPIPSPILTQAQSAFEPAGDPMSLLQTVDHYNARNRVYVAEGMKTPEQKEIAYSVGLLEGKTSNAMRQELIAANQPKIDWSPIQLGKEGVSEVAVKMKVQSELGTIAQYLNRFPSHAGQERGTALISATTNAVRYASLKRGEYDLSNYEKDVTAWGREYKKAYNIYSGSNYAFNKVQQPQISDYEWASVGQYAIDQAHENMKRLNTQASEVDFMQSTDINPLYATITPDNHIIAQDQYGNIAFSAPFSNALVHHAVVKNKEKFKQNTSDKLLMDLAKQGVLK